MTRDQFRKLIRTLKAVADGLRGAINADNFRDDTLSFLLSLDHLRHNLGALASTQNKSKRLKYGLWR
jgi:hypothetical protein